MRVLIAALVSLLCVASAVRVDPSVYPADVKALMNLNVDPCQDFYQYACGGWLANTTLPPQNPVIYRSFTAIEEANAATVLKVLQNPPAQYPKIGAFFNNCMNTDLIESLGKGPLMNLYDIMTPSNADEFLSLVGFLHSWGVPSLFSFSVVPDPGNPNVLIGEFDQGGIVLPDPAMYNPSDPSGEQLFADYLQHVTNMFSLVGEANPEDMAKRVIQLEVRLAAANLPGDQIRNPYSVYHKIDLSGLQGLAPNVPWATYLHAIGAPSLTSLNVGEPTFFQALDGIITTTDADTFAAHLKWNLLHSTANLLSSAFVTETFKFFGTELRGQQEPDPRSTTCVQATDAALGNIVGDAYAAVAFGGASQSLVNAMILDIESAFQSVLNNITWMDQATKTQALTKLSKVVRRVGAPTNPSYYPGYDVIANDYFMSTMSKRGYDFNATIQTLGQAPDKNAWQMTADTVNAYYNPPDNSINFPAGIMQFPFFQVDRDPAENFGGAGMVMGHELTHGFDDQGRMYDGDGKLTNWWSNFSATHFENSCSCLSNQYSAFQVLPGVFVNGNLTLGENVADNGGVKNAYIAYRAFVEKMQALKKLGRQDTPHYTLKRQLARQNLRSDFTENLPLFFVSFAQGWCAKASDAYLKLQVKTDVHSPASCRVKGPLMNFQPFADTFTCPVGTPMNPAQRCTVW